MSSVRIWSLKRITVNLLRNKRFWIKVELSLNRLLLIKLETLCLERFQRRSVVELLITATFKPVLPMRHWAWSFWLLLLNAQVHACIQWYSKCYLVFHRSRLWINRICAYILLRRQKQLVDLLCLPKVHCKHLEIIRESAPHLARLDHRRLGHIKIICSNLIFLRLILEVKIFTMWTILHLNDHLRTFLLCISVWKTLLWDNHVVFRDKLMRSFDYLLLGRKRESLRTRIGSWSAVNVQVRLRLVSFWRELVKQYVETILVNCSLEMRTVTIIVASLVFCQGCTNGHEVVVLVTLVA